MGAKIASFLATLLLSIPLAAIGLMAVFGIPQLVPANAGPEQEHDRNTVFRGVRDAFNWNSQNTDASAPSHEHFDDAPQFGAQDSSALPPRNYEASDNHYGNLNPPNGPSNNGNFNSTNSSLLTSDQSPLMNRPEEFSNGQQPRGPQAFPGRANSSDLRSGDAKSGVPGKLATANTAWNSDPAMQSSALTQPDATLDPHRPMLTWRQASMRLTELGIKKYHLERGSADGSFLFVCLFSPGDAPHVVHRFESEADDPLIAVNQVLQQVDQWMQRRFAASNFPNRADTLTLSAETPRR